MVNIVPLKICYIKKVAILPKIRHRKIKDDIMPYHDENGITTIGLFDFLLKRDSLDL